MALASRLFIALSVAASSVSAGGGTGCLDVMFRDSFEELSMNLYEVELVVSDLGDRSASFDLNGSEVITATADGSYCFSKQVPGGQAYEVSIIDQPDTGNICASDALTGIASSRISIAIFCSFDRTEWDNFNWNEANWN